MSQLKALRDLQVGWNKLPSTEVDYIIKSFPQLTGLYLINLGLTGEHLCSTNGALTRAFAELRHLRRADRRALPLNRAPARAELVPRLAHLVAVAARLVLCLRLGGGRELGREEVRRRRW